MVPKRPEKAGGETPRLRHTPPSGRTFAYAEYGDPKGHPVLSFHGTPGSHLKFEVAADLALALGLRLVAIDRWGYGATPAPPVTERRLSNFAADMASLVETAKWPSVSTVGISGGGPFAAATAVGLGARAAAAALVSPVAPLAGPAVSPEVRRQMRPFHRLAFFAAPRVPGLIRGSFSALRLALRSSDSLAMRLVTARAHAVDRRIACAPHTASRLAKAFRVGLAGGTAGPVIDLAVFSKPWDVDVAKIQARTRVWIGTLDRNVPIAAACALEQASERIDIARLEGAGHFWISENFETVLSWIAQTAHVETGG